MIDFKNIKKPKDKLYAVYSLIEQMRLEHNRQGTIARSNWDKYKDKWGIYSRIFHKKLIPLIEEQNRLKAVILSDNYSVEEWGNLTIKEKDDASIAMFGEKEKERIKSTKASTNLTEELKGVNLDNTLNVIV